VLVPLVTQVALVGVGVGEVAGRGEVDQGLGDLAETRGQTKGQPHDQQEPQRSPNILT
jgi:hypothetical protein